MTDVDSTPWEPLPVVQIGAGAKDFTVSYGATAMPLLTPTPTPILVKGSKPTVELLRQDEAAQPGGYRGAESGAVCTSMLQTPGQESGSRSNKECACATLTLSDSLVVVVRIQCCCCRTTNLKCQLSNDRLFIGRFA